MLGKVPAALLTLAFIAMGALKPAEADFINTTGSDLGDIFNFGDPNTTTYGQLFTVGGSDTFLDSFSLFLRGRSDGTSSLDLRGYIAGWNGFGATSILFESSTQTMNGAGALQEFVFSPDLGLVSGNTYVAFLSISNLPPVSTSLFGMPFGNDSIPGEFVFINNGHNFAALSNPWNLGFRGQSDAWFKASLIPELVSVPEPATAALFGAGLVALASLARRRKTS